MKKTDFTTETETDLRKLLGDMREELRVSRFNVTGSAMRDMNSVRKNKKDVARILTQLRKRQQTA